MSACRALKSARLPLSLNTQNYYADVTMAIGNEIELPDDSSAKITSEGLLDGNYVLVTGRQRGYAGRSDGDLYTQGSVDLIALV